MPKATRRSHAKPSVATPSPADAALLAAIDSERLGLATAEAILQCLTKALDEELESSSRKPGFAHVAAHIGKLLSDSIDRLDRVQLTYNFGDRSKGPC